MISSVRPLRHRNFALIWSAALVSNVGTWMQTVAVGILVTARTGQAGWTGLVAAAGFLPVGLLSPVGGAMADRHDYLPRGVRLTAYSGGSGDLSPRTLQVFSTPSPTLRSRCRSPGCMRSTTSWPPTKPWRRARSAASSWSPPADDARVLRSAPHANHTRCEVPQSQHATSPGGPTGDVATQEREPMISGSSSIAGVTFIAFLGAAVVLAVTRLAR